MLASMFPCGNVTGGTGTGTNCTFPYNYTNNIEGNWNIDWVGCNFHDNDGKRWCYTEAPTGGTRKRGWGDCPSSCGNSKTIKIQRSLESYLRY